MQPTRYIHTYAFSTALVLFSVLSRRLSPPIHPLGRSLDWGLCAWRARCTLHAACCTLCILHWHGGRPTSTPRFDWGRLNLQPVAPRPVPGLGRNTRAPLHPQDTCMQVYTSRIRLGHGHAASPRILVKPCPTLPSPDRGDATALTWLMPLNTLHRSMDTISEHVCWHLNRYDGSTWLLESFTVG
jgi:hypothetical protein